MSTETEIQNGEAPVVTTTDIQQDSQTASDYIDEQLALEADAREILPYKFDKCTYPLGPLRQGVFACLTCSPPPASPAQVYTPAGVCYACSISCHGDHTLVELFTRRNFTCDCGTTRLPSTSPCTIRSSVETGMKGVHSEEASTSNTYNENFQNKFCGCGQEYNPDTERGTMYQCLGLGTVESGGCGEDWWHAHCLLGLPKDWPEHPTVLKARPKKADAIAEEDENPVPENFPDDDDFSTIICYKCVESNSWIKQYAGTKEFLPPLHKIQATKDVPQPSTEPTTFVPHNILKRKASEDDEVGRPASPSKRLKEEDGAVIEASKAELSPGHAEHKEIEKADRAVAADSETENSEVSKQKHEILPPEPSGIFTIFAQKDFREEFCRCGTCFPNLAPHPQLLDEEDEYEPSISDSEQSLINGSGAHSHGTASLLDRGEAALNNVDRVRAIEGVMVYNHLKDKVKAFLKPYAESGKPVGAEDIKAYFEKLRGDEAAIKEASQRPNTDTDDANGGNGDHRREQSGF